MRTVTGSGGIQFRAGAQHTEVAKIDQSGNLHLQKLGGGLRIKEGSNARMGTATLVGGTIQVNNTSVTANTRIILSRNTTGGTAGHLSTTKSAGASFTINSSSGTDTSEVAWMLVEPA